MVLHAAETTSWSSPTVVLPLAAAIVSLLGVLWVSYSSGRRMLRLEERRQVAEASQERMSTLRADRRALYTRLVEWQHEVSQRVLMTFPLTNETHEHWVTRVLPLVQQKLAGENVFQPMVYESLITGSPQEIWMNARRYESLVTTIHHEIIYAVSQPAVRYETYLPNLWVEGSRLQTEALVRLLDDLGIASGKLEAMEQVELLRVENTLKVLRWRRVKKLRFKWRSLVHRMKTRLSRQP